MVVQVVDLVEEQELTVVIPVVVLEVVTLEEEPLITVMVILEEVEDRIILELIKTIKKVKIRETDM